MVEKTRHNPIKYWIHPPAKKLMHTGVLVATLYNVQAKHLVITNYVHDKKSTCKTKYKEMIIKSRRELWPDAKGKVNYEIMNNISIGAPCARFSSGRLKQLFLNFYS